MKIRFLSVSEVNNYINKSLKADPILQSICVYGEVSNVRVSIGGYLFFSIKDGSSKLECVSFEPELLDIDIKDGLEIEIMGSLSFYQKDGSFKLLVRSAKTVGIGKAFEKYLELAKVLEKEGLFSSSKKKEIKEIPIAIGVITSITGAVLQDIRNVTSKRYPQCNIIVYPARVQGEGASSSVIEGVKYFNANKCVDTIIIARGGGAYEDLIEFNDEKLAREVAKSKIPVISAIGHETDHTILDLVSDLRASTPSMAAELALPSKKQLLIKLNSALDTLKNEIARKIEFKEKEISSFKKILDSNSPLTLIEQKEDELYGKNKELKYSFASKFIFFEKELDTIGRSLSLINPILPYEKGFAIIKKKKNIVISANELSSDDNITISFKDGDVMAKIE